MTNMPHRKKTLNLPQLTVTLPFTASSPELLLVGGGRAPSSGWLQSLSAGRQVHAIDHGLDACLAAGIIPDYLLGDGDSANGANWSQAQELAIPTEKHPVAKDLTDTQLCLQKIKAGKQNAFVLLTGCFGGRFDHLFSTIYSFLHSGLNGCMADNHEALFFLSDGQELTINFSCQPKAVSLLPLSPVCTGVTSQGVRWPLANATLTQQMPAAISNEPSPDSQPWQVGIQQGILGIYICFSEAQLL